MAAAVRRTSEVEEDPVDAYGPGDNKRRRKEYMNLHCKEIDSVFKIMNVAIPSDVQIHDKETGHIYTKADLKSMIEAVKKNAKDLWSKVNKTRTQPTNPRRAGFNMISYFVPELINCFRDLDLGPAYQKVETQGPDGKTTVEFRQLNKDIKTLLPRLLKDRISNRGTLTSLFSIYKRRDPSTADASDKKMFVVPPVMAKHLGAVLSELEELDKKNSQDPSFKGRRSKQLFTAEKFSAARQQTIYAKCTRKDDLTEEELARLEDPALYEEIAAESEIVHDTCAYYSSQLDS